MSKRLMVIILGCSLWALAIGAQADTFSVGADDTIEKILSAQKGKRVTVKLGGNEELTGTVKQVTPQVVQLSDLAGKEFFDAAVATKYITAVIVRAR
jgi:hypothetical protein